MSIQLDKKLLRYASTPGDARAKTVMLISSDESTTYDTWEIDENEDLPKQTKLLASEIEEVVKALAPDLARKRHYFKARIHDTQGRVLGAHPLSVTGTSADQGMQSSTSDALAIAMTACASLWKMSLEVAQNQLQQQSEHNAKLQDQLILAYQSDIDRKKVESENTTVTSQQMEKLVNLASEQLPALVEMAQHYAKQKGPKS